MAVLEFTRAPSSLINPTSQFQRMLLPLRAVTVKAKDKTRRAADVGSKSLYTKFPDIFVVP